MANYPTPDIITALAPDAASLKAGRGLASPGKWTLSGGNDDALWGLMQGSGKDPYQVLVLADGTATKCSCPSRKFPCKHALGLLFIAAEQPGKLTTLPAPAWVEEWLASRAEKSAKTAAKAQETDGSAKPPVDEKAQIKRREKRSDRVTEGIAFLNQWLADLTKQGLADAPVTDRNFWETAARRLVDAQAPGLARFVRLAGGTARRGADGTSRLMDDLGRLHLLLTAGNQLDQLDPGLRAEVEQLIGWTVPQESVLAGPGVADHWLVAARTVEEEDRLLTAITWLFGSNSGRWAQLIQTAPVQQPVLTPYPLGRWLSGELAFYPGVCPLRAVWKSPFPAVDPPPGGIATESTDALLSRYATGLASNPWRTHMPFCLRAVTVESDGLSWLVDDRGHGLPARLTSSQHQILTAVQGGRPGPVCGLWDGREATPLTMESDGGWLSLTGGFRA